MSERFISIDEVVSGAMVDCGLEHDGFRNIFRQWSWRATRSIGLGRIDKRWSDKLVLQTDRQGFGFFEKPCDLIYAIEVKLCGAEDVFAFYHEDGWELDRRTGNNSDVLSNHKILSVSERSDRYYISTNANGSITHAHVRYYAAPLDEDGLPRIPEFQERAVAAYCEYMFLKRRRSKGDRNILQGDVRLARDEWRMLRSQAIVEKNMPQLLHMDEIVLRWNTLLPNLGALNKNQL